MKIPLVFVLALSFAGWPALGAEPQPVKVGAGSYAEFPPAGEDRGKVEEILQKKLYIDDSKAGAPIPTNAWWTDLIVSQYCGNLWAHPVTVSAGIEGIKIFHPDKWSDKGNDMVLDFPLEVGGEAATAEKSKDIVIADFEGSDYGPGWHTTGVAFGKGPAQGAFPGQTAVSGYIGKGLANSLYPDDNATGTLTSPAFRVERHYIHFLIGGGRNPDKLRMKLLVNGQMKRSETGEDSERMKWKTWDVSEFNGANAEVEMEDNATGGWAHILVDQIVESDEASPPAAGGGFAPVDARALNWGDWTLSFRMAHSAAQYMDVTLGHGLPFVWTEFRGVKPFVQCDGDAVCSDARGAALGDGASATGDEILIEYGGRFYGIFAPDNTVFTRAGGRINVRFQGAQSYLVVGALPSKDALQAFHQYAFAIPRNSRMDWTYDPARGEVATHWKLETEALKGTNHDLIQGWIPHHYRTTRNNLAFNGMEYLTARGTMKCAVGREFDISYPFNGLLPTLPRPKPLGLPHDYDETRMRAYITENAAKTKYGDDTYWGSKDLINFARYTSIAKELGAPEFETLRAKAHAALADWYTYTPGETAHFFAMYPRWKALVGFKPSYGSEAFNDQHFHYGYFTTSTAVLGMCDPTFLRDYGEMAKLVAKEYANWDRADTRFPYLRTFDVWEGHSWAGGTSSGNGNNQESSSEAVNSWGGLFLLGNMLGDNAMTAAGAMGWAMETSATLEYWFDFYGHEIGPKASTFSPNYEHGVTGILGGGGRAYATYFTGDPGWIYGIQWIPASPSLIHLARDPKFSQWQFDTMMADRAQHMAREGKENTIQSMGNLGGVVLGFTMQFNPGWTAEQFDALWAATSGPDKYDSGDIYYMTHANRMLGPIAWDCHTSIPTSGAYYTKPGKVTWVIYNPKPAPQTATLYKAGQVAGTVNVAANTLMTYSP